ncbi:MAG: hypothetical protein QXQ50_09300 [Candidatus Bathyarchaeia archaeon]
MSGLEKLKQKAEEVAEYLSVTDLPNEIQAKIVSDLVFKVDKRGNEACFITLETPDRKRVVQKYTPSTYKALHEAILNAGGLEYLQNNYVTWTKRREGRAINERLFPQPKTKKKA